MGLNRHGTEDQLEAYALGRLQGSELAELEEHLIVCSECRDRLDEVESFAAGMRDALAAKTTAAERSPRSVWSDWLRKPAFSMVLAAIAVIAIVSIVSNSRPKMALVSTLTLNANRGAMPTARSARELDITLKDSPAEGTFRVEVVNAAGQTVWNGLAQSGESGIHVKTQRQLPPGGYFVRLYANSGEMLREYGSASSPECYFASSCSM